MRIIVAFIFSILFLSNDVSAYASNISNSFFPNKYAAFVVDTKSGKVLQAENANVTRYPASLTKMMTLYLTFEALKHRKLNLDESVVVSRYAASQQRMNLALRTGERITVKNLIDSVVVLSANDSAVVLAEKLGGTEGNFARIMTTRAHQLGMKNTNFTNSSGLPNARQVTTARDMAKLLVALKHDFPQYYHMMALNSFKYKGRVYGTHNNLMKDYAGAKAGKTGFINASGFNLALNAEKHGTDLVGVVMGGKTARLRDNYMEKILDNNFAKLNPHMKSSTHFASRIVPKENKSFYVAQSNFNFSNRVPKSIAQPSNGFLKLNLTQR